MSKRLFRLTTLHVAILLGLSPFKAQALIYDSGVLNFNYNGGNMWGPNSSFNIDRSDFIGLNIPFTYFNERQMVSIAGQDTGVELIGSIGTSPFGGSAARVGINLGGKLDSGSVKVNYSVDAKLNLPDSPLLKGSYVSLGGANNTTVSKSILQTQLGSISMYEDFVYNVPASIIARGCVAGQCASKPVNLGVSVDPFELFSYNRNDNGVVKLFGTTTPLNFNTPISLDANFEIDGVTVGTNLGSVTVHTPTLQTAIGFTDTYGNLNSAGTAKLFEASLDISNAFSLLSASGATNWNFGVGEAMVNITPAALYASPILSLEQQFSFDPNLQVDLRFDHPITASFIEDGQQRSKTSNDFIVSMDALNNYNFRFDADTVITPSFILDNKFRNLSKLDVGLSLDMTELKGSVSLAGEDLFSFPGLTQHLTDADIQKITVFDQAYDLNFERLLGKAFTVKTLGQSVDGLYALWTGQGYDNNWSTASNWQGGKKPVDGDAILFYGSADGRTLAFDNRAVTNINGMTFLEGADSFVVDGNDLSNTGDISNQSSRSQTIKQNVTIAANQAWDGGTGGLNYLGKLNVDNGFNLSLLRTNTSSTASIEVGKADNGTLNVTAGSRLQALGLDMGVTKNSIGKVFVSDTGTQVALSNQLLVGDLGNGDLYIENGGSVSASTAVFAKQESANAYLGLDGSGSELIVSHGTVLANSGLAILRVSNGASLKTASTDMAINSTAGADVQLQGNKTRWAINGNIKAGGDGQAKLLVDSGSQLAVSNNLSWGTGAGRSELQVNQGGLVDVTGDATLGGQGRVVLQGSSAKNQTLLKVAGHTTEQAGAQLSLNNANATFADGLDVAGTLQSQGVSAINGNIQLASGVGQILTKTGQLTLFGDVTHNGATINTHAGATTVFEGAVHGAGNFSGGGNLDFEAGYAPGNSAAAIHFAGDNVTFGRASTLTMELFGSTPGQQYDQLLNMGNLNFQGNLLLNFGLYSPAVASVFNLFDFQSFSGMFDLQYIQVAGIDRARLDFSQLALNGELIVKAVPIPPSFVLLASGLVAMSASSLRRRRDSLVA